MQRLGSRVDPLENFFSKADCNAIEFEKKNYALMHRIFSKDHN